MHIAHCQIQWTFLEVEFSEVRDRKWRTPLRGISWPRALRSHNLRFPTPHIRGWTLGRNEDILKTKSSTFFCYFQLVHVITIFSFLIHQEFLHLTFANAGKSNVTSIIIWSEKENCVFDQHQVWGGNCTQYIAFCQNQSFHKPFSFKMVQNFWRFLLALLFIIHPCRELYWSEKFTKQNLYFSIASCSGLCWCVHGLPDQAPKWSETAPGKHSPWYVFLALEFIIHICWEESSAYSSAKLTKGKQELFGSSIELERRTVQN